MNILIAEDDDVSRRILQINLGNWGYEIVVTTDGQQAWDVLRSDGSPSIAILDIMMPEMDGLEVCRRVRELPSTTPPYIILLTGFTGKDDVVRGIQAGANDYLSKPFHREELRARVAVGVRMVELQKALAERVSELEEALSHVNQLQGMLPICSYCKQVRDDKNYWHQVENYISDNTDVLFSHSICPDCFKRVSEEIKERKQQKDESAE